MNVSLFSLYNYLFFIKTKFSPLEHKTKSSPNSINSFFFSKLLTNIYIITRRVNTRTKTVRFKTGKSTNTNNSSFSTKFFCIFGNNKSFNINRKISSVSYFFRTPRFISIRISYFITISFK